MEFRDLIVTPILLIILYCVMYFIRPLVTDGVTRTYFIPALSLKIVGAIAVGIVYQFYYGSGDTFMYHTYGSRIIWEAFLDSPELGLKLLLSDSTNQVGIYKYASQIHFFRDPSSYAVIRISAIFDLLTFSSYSGTAVLFALVSFIGTWMFFMSFYEQFPHLHKGLAIAAFFIPSVFFWGSGLLKDTITLGCLGAATYQVYRIFLQQKFGVFHVLLLILSLVGLYVIKIYILLTFLPASILWIFSFHFYKIRGTMLKIVLFPFIAISSVSLGYYAMIKASEDNSKYSLNAISQTAKVTAYDIRYWSGREAGSGYSLGELDGTWQSMIRLAPEALGVSLFRPFIWEIRNPLMLLSALESFFLTLFTVYVIFRMRGNIFRSMANPTVLFCMVFSISFAFAVGVSTFNFGTLARYKIPLLPFYFVGLILMIDYSNKERKAVAFDVTE